MCIAILKPKSKIIERERLKDCWDANPNGAGFAVVTAGAVTIFKGFMTFEEFYEAWEPFQKHKALLHFRIATNGTVKPENTHPFPVGNSALIHNGILNIKTSGDETDTVAFIRGVLVPALKLNPLSSPWLKYLIETSIGSSKFIMLHPNGSHTIFNEELGVWEDDVWYSNKTYLPVATPKYDYGAFAKKYGFATYKEKDEYRDEIFQWDMETVEGYEELYPNPEQAVISGDMTDGEWEEYVTAKTAVQEYLDKYDDDARLADLAGYGHDWQDGY